MDLWVTLALGSSIRTSWASWGLVSRGLREKDDNPNISVFRRQISGWFFSPIADEVSRELPVKRFEGRRTPLEVDRGGRGVVRCCHCRLPAWLWWEIFLSDILSEYFLSVLVNFLRFPLFVLFEKVDVCAWGEPLARLSMSILHTASTPTQPHWDHNLCKAQCRYTNIQIYKYKNYTNTQIHKYSPHWVHTYPTALE